MAITLRLSEEQEAQLQEMMEQTGQATKSKAILYMIENSKEILKNDAAFRAIKTLEDEIKIAEKKIAKLKTGK
ncbi:hypothetical protein N5C36_21570 [Shewanella xiamenensis]|uniref:hypothetical protein n=1 Tax=Shewanella xiamenensis TaxID=332186 RepID=UPI00244CA150|nr:hypothetical protein [Shewanella xiamenensis]MDH1316662.1 hypothetical protein [Shewanella xiamenensis]